MKTEKVSNLKKAIFTLLYDQYDVPDIELDCSDSTYVDYIIGALIETNERRCPFKNYDCIGHCKVNQIGCTEGLDVDCNRELEDIWKEFIEIETPKDTVESKEHWFSMDECIKKNPDVDVIE